MTTTQTTEPLTTKARLKEIDRAIEDAKLAHERAADEFAAAEHELAQVTNWTHGDGASVHELAMNPYTQQDAQERYRHAEYVKFSAFETLNSRVTYRAEVSKL